MRAFDSYTTILGQRLFVRFIRPEPGRPVLVFLHDSLGCTALWRDFPAHLAGLTNCNILVYDRKGYGESEPFSLEPRGVDYLEKEADVLHALIEEMQIDEAILFGHSDGGSIALIAAAKYPRSILAVVAEAAHIFVEEETLQGIHASVEKYATTDLRERLSRYHGNKADAVFRAWTETWLRPDYRSWSIEHWLPGISCPVLVIQGTEDQFGTEAQVKGIVHGVQGPTESVLLPGIGHTPHREEEVETLARSAYFINTYFSS